MQLSSHLKNGDVHLSFPQLVQDQITSILKSNEVQHDPVRRLGLWKEDCPETNICGVRLAAGNVDRIEKLVRQAFEDRAQPWVLVKPPTVFLGLGRFDWCRRRLNFDPHRWGCG